VYTSHVDNQSASKTYTIGQLAALAGITVRTLHHYDHIGLLSPGSRDENGYRRYNFSDLLLLQQILFFKELDFPLKEIKNILNNPTTDPLVLLQQHQKNLEMRIDRLKILEKTLQKTIQTYMKKETMPLTDAELYEGFSEEKISRYNREVREIYNPQLVDKVDKKVRNMSKTQWKKIQQEGAHIAQNLATLMNHDPTDPEVQSWIARQHTWIENFYPAPADVFQGLGELYATDPEFRAFYDHYKPGLADFMREAMQLYAETVQNKNSPNLD